MNRDLQSIVALYDKGLVWDDNDHFIMQSWQELKSKILQTHAGVGIIAADFEELLRYGKLGYKNTQHRREQFMKLVANADQSEDIKLLAEILGIILLYPWRANVHAGWFISYLRNPLNLDEFDSKRAASILNELYVINEYAAIILMNTLDDPMYSTDIKRGTLSNILCDEEVLCEELKLTMTPAKVFISYAREDDVQAERLYNELKQKGVMVWKDSHDLLPGEEWEKRIRQTMEECDFIIQCLSSAAIRKKSFFKEELRIAVEVQERRQKSAVFAIPVKLEAFNIELLPKEIKAFHIVNIYDNWQTSIEKILKTFHTYRLSNIGRVSGK